MPTAKKTVKKATKTAPKPASATRLPDGQEATAAKKAVTSKAVEKPVNNGGFAIIETGGKQYRVAVGDTIKIEKIIGKEKEGETVTFDKVLLVDNGKDVTDVGTPYVDGAKVTGTLIETGRDKKVTVIKYRPKSRYFKKQGHRQPYLKVKIDKIV